VAEPAKDDPKPEGKKSSPIVLIAVMAVMSVVAVGAGYAVSTVFKGKAAMEAPSAEIAAVTPAANKKNDRHDGGGSVKKDDAQSKAKEGDSGGRRSVVKLDPIIVTLPQNGNAWLRLELALILGGQAEQPGEVELVQIASDVSGMLRTMELQHISMPSGYVHLKEDLLDRARMTAGETIKDVMIVSLVAE